MFKKFSLLTPVFLIVGSSLFFVTRPSPTGKIQTTEIKNQKEMVDGFFEKNKKGYLCSHSFYGRDDVFIYTDLLCGKFILKDEKLQMVKGFRAPVRFYYDADSSKIIGFDGPVEGETSDFNIKTFLPKGIHEKYVRPQGPDEVHAQMMASIREKFDKQKI